MATRSISSRKDPTLSWLLHTAYSYAAMLITTTTTEIWLLRLESVWLQLWCNYSRSRILIWLTATAPILAATCLEGSGGYTYIAAMLMQLSSHPSASQVLHPSYSWSRIVTARRTPIFAATCLLFVGYTYTYTYHTTITITSEIKAIALSGVSAILASCCHQHILAADIVEAIATKW